MSAIAKIKSKKPKDKNAPKRPSSSYFLFANDHRSKVKDANPEIKKVSEISKLLGQKWKALGADEKKKYQDQAAEMKKIYDETQAAYKLTDEYAAYQNKLKKWKEEQGQTITIKSKNKQKSQEEIRNLDKDDSKMLSKSEIKAKINKFFDRYRDRLRKSQHPRQAVANQYGWGIDKASEWIVDELENDPSGTLYAFKCLASFKAKIGMMDFSLGGPAYEILCFMEKVDAFIDDAEVDQINKKDIRELCKALEKYHSEWDGMCCGEEDIKKSLDKIKAKWSL